MAITSLDKTPLNSNKVFEAIREINEKAFDNTGDVDLLTGKVYKINGVQVVGAKQTGVAAMTNLTAPAVLDADTVTVAQLADIVGNLINKLRTHGLIGD